MPPSALTQPTLSKLSEFISSRMGLHFPLNRLPDLERGISAAAQEFGFDDVGECVHWLTSSPLDETRIETLAGHLTVGETYFFRERPALTALAQHVLPELARRDPGRPLRIWSAGCCTGEEAYSIAMLVRDLSVTLSHRRSTILATDINARFLRKARAGLYTEWSFRATPEETKLRYFREVDAGRFEVVPEVRAMVRFEYLNLVEDIYPSLLNDTNALDVIFCRNVLMYLEPSRVTRVIENFARALVPGGWLFVSPSETSRLFLGPFNAVNFEGVTLYRREPVSLRVDDGPADPLPETPRPTPEVVVAPTAVVTPAAITGQAYPPERDHGSPSEYGSALALYDRGQYVEAEPILLRVLERARAGAADDTGEFAASVRLLARTYANQGRLDRALQCCDDSLAHDKLQGSGHLLRASILLETGDRPAALVALRRALYADPDLILAHFMSGQIALQADASADAERHFTNALELLSRCEDHAVVPESDGLTARRLRQIIASTRAKERPA